MRRLLPAVALALFATAAAAQYPPFCVVGGGISGRQCYYDTLSDCQRAAAQVDGACVVNQEQPRQTAPRPEQVGPPLPPPVFAPATPGSTQVLLFGGGLSNSCEAWLSSERNRMLGNEWALGYWSGQNAGNAQSGGFVGHSASRDEILRQIESACRENLSRPLADAVSRTYVRFRRENR